MKNISERTLRAAIGTGDGACLTISNARARVTITRMESNSYRGARFFVRGDSIPNAPTWDGYLRPLEAFRAALDTLAEYNK